MFTWHPTEKRYECRCGNVWLQHSRCNCPKRCPKCGSYAKTWKATKRKKSF